MSTVMKPAKPIPAIAWDFHPGQVLTIFVEPWLAQSMGLAKTSGKGVFLREVTAMRIYQNQVVIKGSAREAAFPKTGFLIVEMHKQGIVHTAPKPVTNTRLAAERTEHPTGRAYIRDGEIIVQFPYDKALVELVSDIDGEHRYERSDKSWRWEANGINALFVLEGLKETKIDTSEPKLHELAAEAEKERTEIQRRIDAAQVIKTVDPSTLPQPNWLKHDLWQHQLQAFHYAIQFRGSGLFMGLGSGKTMTTIALATNLDAKRILVICPKHVIPVWKMEFEQHCAREMLIVPLEAERGSMKARVEYAKKQMAEAEKRGIPCVLIMTPASAIRTPFGPKFSVDEKGKSTGQIAAKNRGWALTRGPEGANFDMVVVDEAQCLANYRTSISRMCWRFGQMDDVYRLALSGTPAPNDILQFYGVMRFINPHVFSGSYQKFQRRYAITDEYNRVLQYINNDELQRKVFEQAFRVETKDVIKLPPQVFTHRYYDLSAEERKVYDTMKKDMLVYLGDRREMLSAPNVLVKTLRLSQITNGIVEDGTTGKTHIVGDSRLELLREVVRDELPAGEPFVIFVRFKSDIERIKKLLTELGMKAGEVSGRKSEWVAFQNGEYDAIVVQLRSGGAGINLTRAAYVIYYSKDYGYGNYEQTLARVHRPGQTRTTTYITLIASGTIDEEIESVLARKGNLITEFMRQRRMAVFADDVQPEEASTENDELTKIETSESEVA